jgi:hypothetical protein
MDVVLVDYRDNADRLVFGRVDSVARLGKIWRK